MVQYQTKKPHTSNPSSMAKSKLVTLKLSSKVLKDLLPESVPKKKSTASVKVENDTSLTTPKRPLAPKPTNKKASPTPDTPATDTPQPSVPVIKTGFGRGAVLEDRKLDKSGRGVRKWTKKPLSIQSFTGYSISFNSWTGEEDEGDSNAARYEDSVVKEDKGQPPIRIQLKLNNKTLSLNNKKNNGYDSIDDASSIVSTPDVSADSTPAP
jgi:hypothetical protein